MKLRVLVTGGAGYIGSHTVLELVQNGYSVMVIDNLSNSSEESLKRVQKLTGKTVEFREMDIRDTPELTMLMKNWRPDGVIHFAGLKSVSESVENPAEYYSCNVLGTMSVVAAMKAASVKTIVFSSSATVYGEPDKVPVDENSRLDPQNPYGQTKLAVEELLRAICTSEENWRAVVLRYFNPVGAHPSGIIGEDPSGIPNNLMPYICQVAVGKLEELRVFGDDWPTKDGTGVRDYIHVVDLAEGHLKALETAASPAMKDNPYKIYNLGTGCGYSVLDLITAFEKANNLKIKWKQVPRRPGDIAQCWADPSLAMKEMGWKAQKGLEEMCADSWRWQSQNPEGFKEI